jgi:hypothetical protein
VDGISLLPLINLGAIGVIAAMGIVFARGAHADVRRQRDEAFAEIKRLNDLALALQREYLPVLTSSNKALEESATVLRTAQEELRRKGGTR